MDIVIVDELDGTYSVWFTNDPIELNSGCSSRGTLEELTKEFKEFEPIVITEIETLERLKNPQDKI